MSQTALQARPCTATSTSRPQKIPKCFRELSSEELEQRRCSRCGPKDAHMLRGLPCDCGIRQQDDLEGTKKLSDSRSHGLRGNTKAASAVAEHGACGSGQLEDEGNCRRGSKSREWNLSSSTLPSHSPARKQRTAQSKGYRRQPIMLSPRSTEDKSRKNYLSPFDGSSPLSDPRRKEEAGQSPDATHSVAQRR